MKTDLLKTYCKQFVSFTDEELSLLDDYAEHREIKRNNFLLEGGKVCDFIAFMNSGILRHFHIKDGLEKTCDISMGNGFITNFTSFYKGVPSEYYFQALQDTEVLLLNKENLFRLYSLCPKYETLGRHMAELAAERATEIARSLSSEKPEERYRTLVNNHPELLQQVQQKYIANFLGISPESLSRIRSRVIKKPKS